MKSRTKRILPCPFCGEKEKLIPIVGAKQSWVSCRGCDTEGPPCPTDDDSRDQSIDLWNRREGEKE